ncbi:kunitz-type protease inhibitor 2 isoform X2 [Eleutherodactylus coqui]|uniref:kunitz-type protease inhibitor 2 isoform X2 n=1 Tax=Eleutherodactylus coqui TaxID=57060 RepID=UPI00346255E8
MAVWWLRGLLLLVIPVALADPELPCEGYEVVEGYGMENVEFPSQFGVKLLESPEDVADEQACWQRGCDTKDCDVAVMSAGRCYLLRCTFKGYDLCELTQQDGARSYRKTSRGVRPTQDDFCLPEKATGQCRASFTRWFYDAEAETCATFTYGGCNGNLNNHVGQKECMQKCQGVKAGKSGDTEAPSKHAEPASSQSAPEPEAAKVQAPKKENFAEYCAAPAVVGPCRAAFQRWFHDSSSGTCKKFVYGGCNSNKNNYLTETDCRNMCFGRTDDDDYADHNVMHRSVTAVVLPILLALLAATLIGIMILFFVKVAKKNQDNAGFRAMWNPIDDKECLMNSAYTL